ncbi:MAG: hypothetical protein JNK82_05910 [Myxococcaceae bacterium]|nr:hypothetical protein [Myxococcaceae bacterium]
MPALMGISIDFYAGDADDIGRAWANGKRPNAKAHADFSLHLDPTSLDLLSDLMKVPPLLDVLGRRVGGDGDEREANVVDPKWVSAVGVLPPASANQLAEDWLKAVNEEEGEGSTDDAGHAPQAVRELIALCKKAGTEKLEVVLAWSL